MESDVHHEGNDHRRRPGPGRLDQPGVDRFASDGLDDRQEDVSAVEHRDGQQIEYGEGDVDHDGKPHAAHDSAAGNFKPPASRDAHRTAEAAGADAGLSGVREHVQRLSHRGEHFVELFPDARSRPLKFQLFAQHHAHASRLFGRVILGRHRERNGLVFAQHFHLRRFVRLPADEVAQLLGAVHRHALHAQEPVAARHAGAFSGGVGQNLARVGPARSVQVDGLDAQPGMILGFQNVAALLPAAGDDQFDGWLQAHRDLRDHIRPGFDRLAVDRDDPVAGAQAGLFFGAVGFDPADHRSVDRHRHAEPPDQSGQHHRHADVEDRPRESDKDFRGGRSGRQRLAVLFRATFDQLRRRHLR